MGNTRLTITLSDLTYAWLNTESAGANQTAAEFVAALLDGLADPENVERDLIDQLLSDATGWFPSLMTLEEQAEIRDEVLDFLCNRIQEQYASHFGMPMSIAEVRQIRDRLAERAAHCWQQR